IGISYPPAPGITFRLILHSRTAWITRPPQLWKCLRLDAFYICCVDNVENLSTIGVENPRLTTFMPYGNSRQPTMYVKLAFRMIQVKRAHKFQTYFCTFLIGCPQFCPIYPRFERIVTLLEQTVSEAIVRAGVGLMRGGDPCGRPRTPRMLGMTGGDPCGRP